MVNNMNNSDNLVSILVDLGLNPGEARTYVTLIRMGIAEARPLAKNANLPNSKIYALLSNLVERGFITKLEITGKPQQYEPFPYTFVLEELKKNFEMKLNQSKDYFDKLQVDNSENELKNYVKFAQGTNAVRIAIQEIVSQAEKNIYIVPNQSYSEYYEKFVKTRSDIEIISITENLTEITPILKSLMGSINDDTIDKITNRRPFVMISDLNKAKSTAKTVNIITPKIDDVDSVMFQIKHPMIVNFQVGLFLCVIHVMETVIPRMQKLLSN